MTQDSVGETDKSHHKINKKDSEEKEWQWFYLYETQEMVELIHGDKNHTMSPMVGF